MRYIQTIREGDHVSEVYLCKSKQNLTAKNGKAYISLTLQDKTGTLDAKIWDVHAGVDNFEPMDYIFVDGDVTSFMNNLQLSIRRVRVAQEGEYAPQDYFPVSAKDIPQMYQELKQYIEKVKEPHLHQLLVNMLVEDEQMVKAFCNHSAAKSVHHGFIGGLLEHTLSVTKLCYFYCSLYPRLNRDLLLTAAMLHDIGKLWELAPFPLNDYTDDGQLLGHIMLGYELVGMRIRYIAGFPKKTASELRHCILAHHGELEYGSPKKPELMEALALHFADNTDAKMETFAEALDGAQGAEWLGFNRFLDANIRKSTPFEE